ncbi:MAG: HAMP domain-containing histidine kinase [Oscillospiraceae bacterium]|nr:HAMP domain-containing histidine kinase [Oscillospiraceae bacterium]
MKNKTKNKTKKLPPLKFKIAAFFIFLVLLILGLVWVFQTVFLESFYKHIKTEQIKGYASSITDNIFSSDLQEYLTGIYDQSDTRVIVYDPQSREYLQAVKQGDSVVWARNYSDSSEMTRYYEYCKKNGGTLTLFKQIEEPNEYSFDGFEMQPKFERGGNAEEIVYCAVLQLNADEKTAETNENAHTGNIEWMLMLTSAITPVTSVIDTLHFMLICITALVLLAALLFAFYASSRLSKPISQINKAAKELGKQNYNVRFEGKGCREITELADTLNTASTELAKVDNLQKELIANISHDLRTPLTMIIGYGEMMRDLPGENTEENISLIVDEASYLSRLVNDLLDISKLQAGTITLNKTDFNLTDAIAKLLERYAKLREQEGYVINFEFDTSVAITADEVKITQVLYNLINNAINYAGDDKTVIVSQTLTPTGIRVAVTDHGKGIAPTDLPYIWDRYYKVDKSDTHKRTIGGTGLGLSIVKRVLQLHGYSYGVDSAPGNGSTFWFEIPKDKDEFE